LAATVAFGVLCGCGGSGGFSSESVAQIVHASFKAGAAASTVRMAGVVPVSGQALPMSVEIGPDGAMGTFRQGGVRVDFDYVGGEEYVRASAGAGARLLGATIPRGVHVGWVKLQQPSPATVSLSSISPFFARLSVLGTSGLGKAGVVHVDGQRAVRLAQAGMGHVDVALNGSHLPIDIDVTAQGLHVSFDRWNEPVRIAAPAHWTTVAAINRRRAAVHSVAPRNVTLLPSSIQNGSRRFRALGVAAEFDYPASLLPVTVVSTQRAGSNPGAVVVAVGVGNEPILIVTQYVRLPVPVNVENVSALVPSFKRAVDALAGHRVAEHTSTLDGDPLFSFGVFALTTANGAQTTKIYNVFFGDSDDELQCQFTPSERTLGLAACNEMIHTLKISGGGA